jgi:Ctf8
MILGTHQLTGKIETLKEPFCVMERRRGSSSSNPEAMETENDYENENQERSNQTSFHIVGVVRRKFLFNQYPKSIMR